MPKIKNREGQKKKPLRNTEAIAGNEEKNIVLSELESPKPSNHRIRSRFARWQRRSLMSWVLLIVFLIAFSTVFLLIAKVRIEQTNLVPKKHDQLHNIKLTLIAQQRREIRESDRWSDRLWSFAPHYTDGVVSPLWPWVMSWFANADHPLPDPKKTSAMDIALFTKGKWINVSMSLGFLCLLALWLMPRFTISGIVCVLLVGGMGAFLERSTYYQPEPLSYILFFATWVTALSLLRSNPPWVYFLLGVFSGLAWLAKGSVTPLLLVFLVVSSYRFVLDFVPAFFSHRPQSARPSEWSANHHIVGLALVIAGFILVGSARLTFSAQKFGSATHSWPSYWMWQDDFEQSYQLMAQYPNAALLSKARKKKQLPSAEKYFKTHSVEEIQWRLIDGYWLNIRDFFAPKKEKAVIYATHILPFRGYLLAALTSSVLILFVTYLLTTSRKSKTSGIDYGIKNKEFSRQMLFAVGSLLAYGLLYGWYAPIGRGERFMLLLFMPLVYTLVAATEGIYAAIQHRPHHWTVSAIYHAILLLISVGVVYHIGRLIIQIAAEN